MQTLVLPNPNSVKIDQVLVHRHRGRHGRGGRRRRHAPRLLQERARLGLAHLLLVLMVVPVGLSWVDLARTQS